jgi:hypothetical protein
LNNCGSSSREKSRKNLPKRVIRGRPQLEQGTVALVHASKSTFFASASMTMERNLLCEQVAASADASLAEDHWPAVLQLDERGDSQQDWSYDDQPEGCQTRPRALDMATPIAGGSSTG